MSLVEATMPPAKEIADAAGGKWTLVDGVALLNGQRAGGNANTVAVAYARKVIYSKNRDGLWFAWNGSGWIGSREPELAAADQQAADERKAAADKKAAAAAAATARLAASGLLAIPVNMKSIKDHTGKLWTLENGVALVNGQPAGGNANTIAVVYADNAIYSQNVDGLWFLWNGAQWVGAKDPALAWEEKRAAEQQAAAAAAAAASVAASGLLAIPANMKTIKDAAGKTWTLVDGVALVDGKPAAGNANTVAVVYAKNTIYTLNRDGLWFSWTGAQWVSARDPR